jgi:peptidoglycan/xylan/chitin deacetylase (PgdA/CDA1 family)
MKQIFFLTVLLLAAVLAAIFFPELFILHKGGQAKNINVQKVAVAQLNKSNEEQAANIDVDDKSPFHGAVFLNRANLPAVLPEATASAAAIIAVGQQLKADYSQPNYPAIKFPIFNYHNIAHLPESATITDKAFNVTPELFEEQLKYFQENGYVSVPLDYLIEYFDTGKSLPPKIFAITFDDGHLGQYDYAFPLLKKYGFTATFFIVVDWANHSGFVSWDEIKEMSNAGMAINSHSMTHFNMQAISPDRLKWEMEESKKILEEKTGKPVDYLAYPGGSYNQSVIDAAMAAGYKGAMSVRKVIEQSPKWRFSISRFHADDNMDSIISKLKDY